MTQEDKELLLKDLCARLPYGLCVQDEYGDTVYVSYNDIHFANYFDSVLNGTIKPYLFPISSITEEIIDEIYNNAGVYDIDSSVHIEVGTKFEDLTKMFGILHKHHIDYQNLIPKGLAIDATGLNIY